MLNVSIYSKISIFALWSFSIALYRIFSILNASPSLFKASLRPLMTLCCLLALPNCRLTSCSHVLYFFCRLSSLFTVSPSSFKAFISVTLWLPSDAFYHLPCGFESRLVQDFQRNIMFLPSQYCAIASMLCSMRRNGCRTVCSPWRWYCTRINRSSDQGVNM